MAGARQSLRVPYYPPFTRASCAILTLLCIAACSRTPPDQIRLQLDREQYVSVGIFDGNGKLVTQPVTAKRLPAGSHLIELPPDTSPGTWSWRAVGYDPFTPELLATLAGGTTDLSRGDELALVGGGDAGPPCAVAADEKSVFLGWRAAVAGHEIVAVDPNGRVLWGHHHGPGKSGVRALAASDGVVHVLGTGESEESDAAFIYKLDAATGAAVPWEGRPEPEIQLTSLWPADGEVKPSQGTSIAAKNGRVYVTFGKEEFIAALDAKTGNYVITLNGPAPTQMALSVTPMTDPQDPNITKVIDFGVCALAGNGIAYFVMEHDPAWVIASTTRWLQEDERIAAIALTGDTMKSGKATIYTALGDPHHQVQLRSVDNAESFTVAVGNPGGRRATGAWEPGGFRDIRAIAVDATGQLWVAEGDENFGRFSVWRTDDKQGTLVREIFGPIQADLLVDLADPLKVTTRTLQWKIDPAAQTASLLSRRPKPVETLPGSPEFRDDGGLLLWSPAGSNVDQRLVSGNWRIWRGLDGHIYAACSMPLATHVFSLPGLDAARMLGTGGVTIPAK
jgi:hypothetical protein